MKLLEKTSCHRNKSLETVFKVKQDRRLSGHCLGTVWAFPMCLTYYSRTRTHQGPTIDLKIVFLGTPAFAVLSPCFRFPEMCWDANDAVLEANWRAG